VRAPNVGVSNPLRKRSAVAKSRSSVCFLYTYNGRLPHCEAGLSPSVHDKVGGVRLEFPAWWHAFLFVFSFAFAEQLSVEWRSAARSFGKESGRHPVAAKFLSQLIISRTGVTNSHCASILAPTYSSGSQVTFGSQNRSSGGTGRL
jgi:hypothetical protein